MPLGLTAVLVLLSGCRTAINHDDPVGPRWAGDLADRPPPAAPSHLSVVAFNIQYAEEIDSALVLLRVEPDLRNADILLLQEMDEAGARRIAEELGLAWRYYPAIFNLRNDRNFGNAVLSRWPIVADRKILLPHVAAFTRSRRIATAATVRVGPWPVRVYSTHLATQVQMLPGERREQLAAVLEDAEPFDRVIIGGDLNSHGLARLAKAVGFRTPTDGGERTTALGNWDHIFLRGFGDGPIRAGVVTDVRSASDHRPVWVRLPLPRVDSPARPERVPSRGDAAYGSRPNSDA